jgi:hypothetical protein
MKVVDWISYDDAADKTESVGWLGGWFGFEDDDHHRWPDYLAHFEPDVHPYLEALKEDVLGSGRFFTGEQHQDSNAGVPLFEDGTVGKFSFRAWGDLMAAIATVKDGKDHNYMEFYY